MKVIERMIQKFALDAPARMQELQAQYGNLDAKWGFPPQKVYRCLAGSIPYEFTISEREWESLEQMESTYARAMATPEWTAFMAVAREVFETHRVELYVPA